MISAELLLVMATMCQPGHFKQVKTCVADLIMCVENRRDCRDCKDQMPFNSNEDRLAECIKKGI